VAEQKQHLQRLKDVIKGQAEERLVEAAGTLWASGLQRNAIMDMLDTTFGPDFWEDDEGDELGELHPALVKAKAEYADGTLAPEARAIIESIFGEGFFTGAHVEDEDDAEWSVEVDDGATELVKGMSAIDGVETLASSQGGRHGLAYVTFRGPNAIKFANAMTSLMAEALAGKGLYTIGENTFHHVFSLDLSVHLCMKWNHTAYALVLEVAKEAIEKVKTVEKMTGDYIEQPVVARPVVGNFGKDELYKRAMEDTVAAFRDGRMKG
jgi:hypothetical protein